LILFSPHNDDEALFASFTILRYHPHVVVCLPSTRDYGCPLEREEESRAALDILDAGGFTQWKDHIPTVPYRVPRPSAAHLASARVARRMLKIAEEMRPERVWAPSLDCSHRDHLLVAQAALSVFGDRVETYQTYNAKGKVRGDEVPYERAWLDRKIAALACYRTQIVHPRARDFFDWDLREYR